MKRKTLLSAVALAGLILGISGHANAIPFSSTQDFADSGTNQGRTYYEIQPQGTQNANPYIYEWTQSITFDPAAASINSASLTLSHTGNSNNSGEFWFLSNNLNVKIGDLVRSTYSNNWVDQVFDISSLLSSFSGSTFTLALKLTENTSGRDIIWLDKSVIEGDYTEVPPPPPPSNPVPEPATMLLMGTGLAGLATIQRRRMKKKD